MKFKNIASGSKGNCSIILCGNTKILIDVGLSYGNIKKHLEELNFHLDDFHILLTHSHSDHIKGLAVLTKNSCAKIYLKEDLYQEIKNQIHHQNIEFIDDKITIDEVEIEVIPTSHDAISSVGYIINYQGKSLVYVTDTGYINRKILEKMKEKEIYFIESNHDEKMLMEGSYPYLTKQRILSDIGHLSNKTTAHYLEKIVGPNTKYVFLAHLSEKNNTEELAKEETMKKIGDRDIEIFIARQEEESPYVEV